MIFSKIFIWNSISQIRIRRQWSSQREEWLRIMHPLWKASSCTRNEMKFQNAPPNTQVFLLHILLVKHLLYQPIILELGNKWQQDDRRPRHYITYGASAHDWAACLQEKAKSKSALSMKRMQERSIGSCPWEPLEKESNAVLKQVKSLTKRKKWVFGLIFINL